MEDNTEQIKKPVAQPHESHLLGISIRGWLAFLMTYTACLAANNNVKLDPAFESAWMLALGFYFSQKAQQLPPSK